MRSMSLDSPKPISNGNSGGRVLSSVYDESNGTAAAVTPTRQQPPKALVAMATTTSPSATAPAPAPRVKPVPSPRQQHRKTLSNT